MITKRWKKMTDFSKGLFLGSCLLFLGIVTYYAPEIYAQVTLFNGLTETISTLADGDILGANDANDSNQMKQVLASTVKTYTSSAPTFTGLTKFSVETGMSATNPGVQGDTPITTDIAQVSTVGTTSDAVTLPTAVAGQWVMIINDGANALEIWPASGDNLGAGVDTALATDLAAGSNVTFRAYDATNWEEIAGGGGASVPAGDAGEALYNDGSNGITSAGAGEASNNVIIKAGSAQSGDLLEIQTNAGNPRWQIDSNYGISSSTNAAGIGLGVAAPTTYNIIRSAGNLQLRHNDGDQLIVQPDTTNEIGSVKFADSTNDIGGGVINLRGETTDATPTEIFDSRGVSLPLASGDTIVFQYIVSGSDNTNSDSGGYILEGVIENAAGTTQLVGTVTKTVLAEDVASWDVSATADDTNDTLDLTVTGDADTADTVYWTAICTFTQSVR